jgi:biopolymer transport protein ExbB
MILQANAMTANINPQDTFTLFDLLIKGGVVMIPILLLSILAIYIFVEKLVYISKSSKTDNFLAQRLIDKLADGKIDEAKEICRRNNAMGRVFENGLHMVGQSIQDVESTIESAANIEISRMEKHTSYLGIIAGIAPMLGFIGTISGVIKIFYNISLTDNISIGIIAGGLYQKMVCSGAGLIVGVVAYACYHFIQMQIDKFTAKLQYEELNFVISLKK